MLVNVPITGRLDLDGSPAIREAVSDVESTLADRGRILLRASGTEPLIRVMVEGDDEHQVTVLAEQVAEAVREASGAA